MRKTGFFVRKPEVNRTLGRPRRRWEENVLMDLIEIRWIIVGCIQLL